MTAPTPKPETAEAKALVLDHMRQIALVAISHHPEVGQADQLKAALEHDRFWLFGQQSTDGGRWIGIYVEGQPEQPVCFAPLAQVDPHGDIWDTSELGEPPAEPLFTMLRQPDDDDL